MNNHRSGRAGRGDFNERGTSSIRSGEQKSGGVQLRNKKEAEEKGEAEKDPVVTAFPDK
jgi:hypothetical protein